MKLDFRTTTKTGNEQKPTSNRYKALNAMAQAAFGVTQAIANTFEAIFDKEEGDMLNFYDCDTQLPIRLHKQGRNWTLQTMKGATWQNVMSNQTNKRLVMQQMTQELPAILKAHRAAVEEAEGEQPATKPAPKKSAKKATKKATKKAPKAQPKAEPKAEATTPNPNEALDMLWVDPTNAEAGEMLSVLKCMEEYKTPKLALNLDLLGDPAFASIGYQYIFDRAENQFSLHYLWTPAEGSSYRRTERIQKIAASDIETPFKRVLAKLVKKLRSADKLNVTVTELADGYQHTKQGAEKPKKAAEKPAKKSKAKTATKKTKAVSAKKKASEQKIEAEKPSEPAPKSLMEQIIEAGDAGLTIKEKLTMMMPGALIGAWNATELRWIRIKLGKYNGNVPALKIHYTVKGKQKQNGVTVPAKKGMVKFVLLSGHDKSLEQNPFEKVDTGSKFAEVKRSRYSSFDPAWTTDFREDFEQAKQRNAVNVLFDGFSDWKTK